MQKNQVVFKFLLFSIVFEIPLKFTNVKFLLGFYNLMSLDKNKNLLSSLQVIVELQTFFGANATPLSPCVFTVLCPLEDVETKDLAGEAGERDTLSSL